MSLVTEFVEELLFGKLNYFAPPSFNLAEISKNRQRLSGKEELHGKFFRLAIPTHRGERVEFYRTFISRKVALIVRKYSSKAAGLRKVERKSWLAATLKGELLAEIKCVQQINRRRRGDIVYDLTTHSENIWIGEYLFASLLFCFFELIYKFRDESPVWYSSLSEFYSTELNEVAPSQPYLVSVESKSGDDSHRGVATQGIRSWEPVDGDLAHRPNIQGVLSYSELIKDGGDFRKIEQRLYEDGVIVSSYHASTGHGIKLKIALVFMYLYEHGYFHQTIYKRDKEGRPNKYDSKGVRPVHVRKFVSLRYFADERALEKQFQSLGKELKSGKVTPFELLDDKFPGGELNWLEGFV